MISIEDVYRSFIGSLTFNIKMMKEFCGVRTVEFSPKDGSPLRVAASPLSSFRLPLDFVIAPSVLLEHGWDLPTMRLVRAVIEGRVQRAVLVDIGANVGLFTRQILNASAEFEVAFAYEPHPENFACLVHNTSPLIKVNAFNDALSDEPGVLTFYIDPNNSGNYSVHSSAMPSEQVRSSISVSAKAARAEAKKWKAVGLPIFYKSDTQGHDEFIATSMDISFWDDVFAGMIEIWSIEKAHYSRESFIMMLDRFPNKRFVQDFEVPVSSSEVAQYADRRDGNFKDLLFWR